MLFAWTHQKRRGSREMCRNSSRRLSASSRWSTYLQTTLSFTYASVWPQNPVHSGWIRQPWLLDKGCERGCCDDPCVIHQGG